MGLLSLTLGVLIFAIYTVNGIEYVQPEQIHLSYGGDPSEMVVTWVTMQATMLSFVEYGTTEMDDLAKGSEETFVDGGSEKRSLFMHRVTITGLTPGQKYIYHVGSPLGWSEIFYFTAMQSGQAWSPRLAIFGDMGNVNAQSIARLQEETQRGHFDAILHVGDFAYNMDDDNARVGDEFMKQIQSVAGYIPYMTVTGNHEQKYNFSNYANRFSMPGGDGHSMFYSFNMGPVHFVGFNSEYYYYVNYGTQQIANQYRWLEQDLKEANKPENRALRPWLITMCHRPLYCTNADDGEHCTNLKNNSIRTGYPNPGDYNIEDLLYKYNVDIHFQAHEHSYERMFPTYDLKVCNGSGSDPYNNPRAPVHIVTGSGGCQELPDPFLRQPYPWSATHSDDYGYTRMTVYNNTHVYLDQVSDDRGGEIVDKVWISKDRPTQQNFNCHLEKPQKIKSLPPKGEKKEEKDTALHFKPAAKLANNNMRQLPLPGGL